MRSCLQAVDHTIQHNSSSRRSSSSLPCKSSTELNVNFIWLNEASQRSLILTNTSQTAAHPEEHTDEPEWKFEGAFHESIMIKSQKGFQALK